MFPNPTLSNQETSTQKAESLTPLAETLPPILTVEEVATYLRINRDTAYKAVATGEIPGAHRIGRTIRISRDAMLEWLRDKNRVPRSRRTR